MVLTYRDRINRGQGAAMSLSFSHCHAPLVAQMESDDERERTDSFQVMMDALADHPDWDGVSCLTKCVGWERPGMLRYVEWQNSLVTPHVRSPLLTCTHHFVSVYPSISPPLHYCFLPSGAVEPPRALQDLQKGRFIEIPALHQTALFKRKSLLEVPAPSPSDTLPNQTTASPSTCTWQGLACRPDPVDRGAAEGEGWGVGERGGG